MKSHDLAKLLLTLPDLPIAVHANNHTYFSTTHGLLRVGKLRYGESDNIVIGNFHRFDLNPPNWYITEEYKR